MPTCTYCKKKLKPKEGVYVSLDMDLPKLYFCNKVKAELWLTTIICKMK